MDEGPIGDRSGADPAPIRPDGAVDDVTTVDVGLVGVVNRIARELQSLGVATDGLRTAVSDRLDAVQSMVSDAWKSEVDLVAGYRADVDESNAESRRIASQNSVALRGIEARLESVPTETAVDEMVARVERRLDSLPPVEAVGPQLEEVTAALQDARETIEGLAAATQANSVAFAETMRVIRELKSATDQQTDTRAADAHALNELTEAVRTLRGAIEDLVRSSRRAASAPAAATEAAAAAPPGPAVAPDLSVLDDLATSVQDLREDLVKLKRRMAVRASPKAAPLGDDQIERIVTAVVTRLGELFEFAPD